MHKRAALLAIALAACGGAESPAGPGPSSDSGSTDAPSTTPSCSVQNGACVPSDDRVRCCPEQGSAYDPVAACMRIDPTQVLACGSVPNDGNSACTGVDEIGCVTKDGALFRTPYLWSGGGYASCSDADRQKVVEAPSCPGPAQNH